MIKKILIVALVASLSGCAIEYDNPDAEAELYSTLDSEQQQKIREGIECNE